MGLRQSLIGVVTTRKLSHQVLAANLPYLLTAKEAGHAAVLFRPAAVDWSRNIVFGVTLSDGRRGNQLIASHQQLPAVIYNRVPTRSEENSPTMLHFFRHSSAYSVPVFNASFLSKDKIDETLRLSNAARYLPETEQTVDDERIHQYLKRYGQVYLKPVNGSHGRGIIRLQRSTNSAWKLDYGFHSSYHQHCITSFQEMMQLVTDKTDGRSFVMQRGIKLKRYQNHPIDFRLHLHRGTTGAWEVIYCAAQAGVDRSVATNARSGGLLLPAAEVLRKWYGSMGETRLYKLGQIAQEIAVEVQHHHEGLFGELGLDLGIDQNDQVWLIEVNSKPAPIRLNDDGIQTDSRARSAMKIVEFASYLVKARAGEVGS